MVVCTRSDMPDSAVILAAGMGSRIRADGARVPKPLVRVDGVSLIERTALSMCAVGVARIIVVVGFMGDRIRHWMRRERVGERLGVTLEFVENRAYQLANGVSVLAVRDAVEKPFLLTMADHVYEPRLVAAVARADLRAADLYLGADRRVDSIYDPDDATKLRTSGGRIIDIGKQLEDYDCIDTGVFSVTPALLDALEEVRRERGDCSLSDGVRRLAGRGAARVVDIGDAFWQDVDTLPARARAERELQRLSARDCAMSGALAKYSALAKSG